MALDARGLTHQVKLVINYYLLLLSQNSLVGYYANFVTISNLLVRLLSPLINLLDSEHCSRSCFFPFRSSNSINLIWTWNFVPDITSWMSQGLTKSCIRMRVVEHEFSSIEQLVTRKVTQSCLSQGHVFLAFGIQHLNIALLLCYFAVLDPA